MRNTSCELPDVNAPSKEIPEILAQCRTIAVVGLSPKESRDSNRVARYLMEQGYDRTEAETLVREAKGIVVDSFVDADVVGVLGEGRSYKNHVVKKNELVIVVKQKLEGYRYPNLIRYKGLDWYPMSIRRGDDGWEYYLKVAH